MGRVKDFLLDVEALVDEYLAIGWSHKRILTEVDRRLGVFGYNHAKEYLKQYKGDDNGDS